MTWECYRCGREYGDAITPVPWHAGGGTVDVCPPCLRRLNVRGRR